MRQATTERQPSDPTEAAIRAACLEIQSEWSPAERYRRSGGMDCGIVAAAVHRFAEVAEPAPE